MNKEIPKIIHYCWFGGKPLPKSAHKYIKSWKKFFPGYEIKRWDESNFDVNVIPYTKEAYKVGKYAFVSDYARFKILYEYGGVYFDTDVRVIKSYDDILSAGPFMGRELSVTESEKVGSLGVNAGLGLATYPSHSFYNELLDLYGQLDFIDKKDGRNQKTVVDIVSDLLSDKGLKNIDDIQEVAGLNIYPCDYFCPKSPVDNKIRLTANTHSIHEFAGSWIPAKRRRIQRFGKKYPRLMRTLLIIKHLADGTRPL